MSRTDTEQARWRDPANEPTLDQAEYLVEYRVDSLHVGETFATVVAEVREGWQARFRDDRHPQARKVRGLVYRAAILRHLKNRNLYDAIYGGGMSALEQEITTRLYGGRR